MNEERVCEHGRSWHCQSCDVKFLHVVIKDLKQTLRDADSLVSLLHHRGYINYVKKGCPDQNEVSQLVGQLRVMGTNSGQEEKK